MKGSIFLFFLFSINVANAQWDNSKKYAYDFGAKYATFNKLGGQAISKKGKAAFLPEPNNGFVRVSIHPASDNGAVTLTGKNSLEITQSITRPVKFSGYGIEQATDVLYATAKIEFSKNEASTSAGAYTLAFGNDGADGSLFKNTGNSVYRSTSEVFSAIRWTLSGASTITFAYRLGSDASKTTTYTNINNTTFVQGNNYKVEVYCNNSGVEQTYTRDGAVFTLPNDTFNVWTNGTQIGKNFPRSIEVSGDAGLASGNSIALENKKSLNSYIFLADGSSAANGKLTISDLSLSYK